MKITIGGSWDGAKRAMDATARYAKSTADKIKSSKIMSMLGSSLSSLGIGLTAGGALASLGALVNTLDNIGKSADNLGVTTDELQKMQFAASRTNTNMEQVRAGFAKVIKMTADANSGNADAQNVFARLGLDPQELAKLSPKEIFDTVNSALSSMGDLQERNALSAKLYGESYMQLNNFLRDYLDLGNEAAELGTIIDEEQIRSAEKLNDSITNLNRALVALASNTGIIGEIANAVEGLNAASNNGKIAEKGGVKTSDSRLDIAKNYAITLADTVNPLSWATKAVTGKGIAEWLGGDRENNMATGPTTQADKDAMAQKKKERAKKAADKEAKKKKQEDARDYALLDQAAKESEAAAQKQAQLEELATKRVSDRIAEMQKQAKYQQMINTGLEKEVEIAKALDAAEKSKGSDLTAAEVAAVTQAATDLYNARAKSTSSSSYRAPEMGFSANALERIGANTGLSYQAPNSMQSQQLAAVKQAAAAAQTAALYTQQIAGAVTAPGGSERIMTAP